MRFENPWYLLLLVLLLFFFINKKGRSVFFSIHSNFDNNPLSLKVFIYKLFPYIKALCFVFFIITLANPQLVNEKIKRFSEGIDIMILLDVSDSMRSEDFKPNNRLKVAKNVIKDFINNRTGDRVGLIVFSGESFTKCPLTTDYDVLLNRLSEVEINTGQIKHGTAIGMSIANGVARFKNSKSKTKIMVLLTDGENNTGVIDPITASELAADNGIKIYSIAIGKDGKVPYPINRQNFFGKNVKQYTYINNKLDTEIFTKISSITNANFYRATDSDALSKIFNKINTLEKSKVKVQKSIKVKDLFYHYLKITFMLFLLILFLEYFYLRRVPA